MFNKQELEYLYMAVNHLPPPNTTQGGRAKAGMIAKLCNLMDEMDKDGSPKEGELVDPSLKSVGAKK